MARTVVVQHDYVRSKHTYIELKTKEKRKEEKKVWRHIIRAEKIILTSKHTLLSVVMKHRRNSHLSLDMKASHATEIRTSQQAGKHAGFYIDRAQAD